jgi:hypothetical protein
LGGGGEKELWEGRIKKKQRRRKAQARGGRKKKKKDALFAGYSEGTSVVQEAGKRFSASRLLRRR